MTVVRADAIRTLNYSGISGTYAAVGAALTNTWRTFRITNNTNGDILISFDGSTDNLFVPAGSFVLYDLATNSPPSSQQNSFVLQIGTQFYAKQSTAPSSGDIWIEGLYAKGV